MTRGSPSFYDAIKAKYPSIQVISTMRTQDRNFVHTRKPDLLDDHFYVDDPDGARGKRISTTTTSRKRDEGVRRASGRRTIRGPVTRR